MPVWLAWVSFVLAVVALAGPIGFFAFLATSVWTLIVALLMWRFEQTLPVSANVLQDASGDAAGPVRMRQGLGLPGPSGSSRLRRTVPGRAVIKFAAGLGPDVSRTCFFESKRMGSGD